MGDRRALIVSNTLFEDTGLQPYTSKEHLDAEALGQVLSDPEIGGYRVDIRRDLDCQEMRIAIARFLHDAQRGDSLVIYYIGLGILDDWGQLYLATTDTNRELISATAVSPEFLIRELDSARSRSKVVILDCTYSGALLKGMVVPRNLLLLSSSGPTEYIFETTHCDSSETPRRAFSSALATGLSSGEGDLDGDGVIHWDELFNYAQAEVEERASLQHPRIFNLAQARIPAGKVKQPIFISYAREDVVLAEQLRQLLEDKGHRVWIDERGIPAGEDWRDELGDAINLSKLIVAVLSNEGFESQWVRRELLYADKVGKPILPVVRERIAIPPWFDLHFGGIQQLEMKGEATEPAFASTLEAAVRKLLTNRPRTG